MTKKYGFWQAAGDIVGAAFAVPTFGASMVLSPTARGLVGNILGSGGDDDSGIDQAQKNYQAQMEQWKLLSEERRKELERLREKEIEKEKQVKRNEEEINSLKSKINDPNTSDDERNRLKKRLIVLEDDNKRLKGELTTIRTQITSVESDKPPAPNPSNPWKLPKLSAYDKLLVVAMLMLIIYFLFLREDKKR